jgi:hypothetical protein
MAQDHCSVIHRTRTRPPLLLPTLLPPLLSLLLLSYPAPLLSLLLALPSPLARSDASS